MRPVLILIGLIPMLSWASWADTPDTLWTRTYERPPYGLAYDICTPSTGGFILAGSLDNRLFSAVRADAQGDTLWTRSWAGNEPARSVIEASDTDFVLVGSTAYMNFNVYASKVSNTGTERWVKTYDLGFTDHALDVEEVPGGFLVGGHTLSTGAGGLDLLLMKLNADGDTLWTRAYGGTADDRISRLAILANGTCMIAGQTNSYGAGGSDIYLVNTTVDGDFLSHQTYGGWADEQTAAIEPLSDGGCLVLGDTWSTSSGHQELYLLRITAEGDTAWTRTYQESYDHLTAADLVVCEQGMSYVILARVGYGSQQYLLKVDDTGGVLWEGMVASTNTFPTALVHCPEGGYAYSGFCASSEGSSIRLTRLATDNPSAVDGRFASGRISLSVYPNPVDVTTSVSYRGVPGLAAELGLFDCSGRLLGLLVDGAGGAGARTVSWEAIAGRRLTSPGVYFLRLTTGPETRTVRVLSIHR